VGVGGGVGRGVGVSLGINIFSGGVGGGVGGFNGSRVSTTFGVGGLKTPGCTGGAGTTTCCPWGHSAVRLIIANSSGVIKVSGAQLLATQRLQKMPVGGFPFIR
jgi:hypothetical protein